MGPKMTYEEAKSYLSSLEGRGWRLGLDRMTELLRRGDLLSAIGKEDSPKFIHVAGTNGKGTVTAFIQSILKEYGFRAGGYFSPYVYCLRERVQFNCEMISEVDFADLLSELRPIVESFSGSELDDVTEFECKTALGFAYWKMKRCDWVACEVGLGGRLDATNVLTPKCSVITSIGLDHTQYLGETHAEIATEKAGIIKPGIPVVVGVVPSEAERVIREIAGSQNAPCFVFGKEFGPNESNSNVGMECWSLSSGDQISIQGSQSEQNAWLAGAAIRLSGVQLDEYSWKVGLAKASLPGRMEKREFQGTTIILDGAHNAEAAKALVESLQELKLNWILVSNMLEGHDPLKFYEPLSLAADSIYIPPIKFHRARNPETTATLLRNSLSEISVQGSVMSAMTEAISHAKATGAAVLVTGSFYLVGECGRWIEENLETRVLHGSE